ncbi:MAG: deoxyguanosinetriphosphate triphosphohydrolase [Oscillospiraceae bacterium]|nr:deoxyguanosinetriphosphate triphosphohydrolase [Oscillospiraceae bacterium]
MTIRERYELIEKEILSPAAMLAINSKGRKVEEDECDVRTVFCRDRDRILHSKAFRRLKQKTQVFISPEGDHYRTRLTHTLEVSQIARTLARAFRLNEDLTEAIALGHDLGHTPFGHAGERVLDQLCSFGFRHYEQSVRVVEFIEKDHKGLNLTYETIDGIGNHTTGKQPETMEGKIVRIADRIAFLNHDIEDAITASVFSESLLPETITDVLGIGKSERITTAIDSLLRHSTEQELSLGKEVQQAYDELYRYMFDNVYLNTATEIKSEEHKVQELISILFDYYIKNYTAMPEFYRYTAENESPERAVVDYISGMSDAYATYCFETLFIPKPFALQF